MKTFTLTAFAPLAFIAAAAAQSCPTVDTRPPEGRDQKPTFPGQTRACAVKGDVAFDVTVVAKGLQHPWAVEPLPNGDFLVTERPGRMRVVSGNATSVARGVLARDNKSIEQARVIFQALPAYDGSHHFGSRLAFGPDGMLYVTTGDRSDRVMRPWAQRWDGHMGKTLRITTVG